MATSQNAIADVFADVHSDRLLPELPLFFLPISHTRWQKRCTDWMAHVNVYASLANGSINQDEWKDVRVTFLNQHLDTVDSKFGMLLNVNTLLLVALNVILGVLFNLNKCILGP